MKVTLAVETDGHKPDSTIELEDYEALQLINTGRAREVPTPKPTTKEAKEAAAVQEAVAADVEAHNRLV